MHCYGDMYVYTVGFCIQIRTIRFEVFRQSDSYRMIMLPWPVMYSFLAPEDPTTDPPLIINIHTYSTYIQVDNNNYIEHHFKIS